MDRFIFDVDGTLTPSRRKMDKDFCNWFESFATHNPVYLVTGSDRKKTIEQVGSQIYNLAMRVYNCSGNDVYEQNKCIYSNNWTLPEDAEQWLLNEMKASKFVLRTGNHIEKRPGMVNFSVVGRNATLGERKLYVDYDIQTNERNTIAKEFNRQFFEIDAKPGGETGIDIAPFGCDKSQILKDFTEDDNIIFFGDRMDPQGNDYPLSSKNKGTNYHVKEWRHTWEILNENFTNRT